MKNKIIESIKEILKDNNVAGNNQYIAPNIPMQKINKFINSNELSLTFQDIIFLDDQTVFGGAKESLIITYDSIYVKEAFEDIRSFRFIDIEEIYSQKRKLYINGRLFCTLTLTDVKYVTALSQALQEICSFWSELLEELQNEDDESDDIDEDDNEEEIDDEDNVADEDDEVNQKERSIQYYLYETEDSEDEQLHKVRIQCAFGLQQGGVPLEKHIVLNDWFKKQLQNIKNQNVTKKLRMVGVAEKFTDMLLAPTSLHTYEATKKNYNEKAEHLEFLCEKTAVLLELVINFSESLFKEYYVNDEDFKFAMKNEIITFSLLAFLHGAMDKSAKNDDELKQFLNIIFKQLILKQFIEYKVNTVKGIDPQQILEQYNRIQKWAAWGDLNMFYSQLMFRINNRFEEWVSSEEIKCYHSFNYDKDSFQEAFFAHLRLLVVSFYNDFLAG